MPVPLNIPFLRQGLVVLLIAVTLTDCGDNEARTDTASFLGIEEGNPEWFWRDVLAAPLPGTPPPRKDILSIKEPRARLDALAELAPAQDPATSATLMAALRDPQIAVAAAAAHDLGAFGYVDAIPRLLKGIGPWPVDYDVPLEVRAAQASALARLNHPGGIELLLSILAEKTHEEWNSEDLQWTRTGQMAFIQELALPGIKALAGTDFNYNTSAPIPWRTESVRNMLAWWEQNREALWAATAPLDEPALAARIKVIVDNLDAYQLRQIDGARFTLAQLGPGVIPYLAEGLQSQNDYLRLHCLEVMEDLTQRVDGKTKGRLAIMASPLLLEDVTEVAAQAANVCGAARVADPLVIALRRRHETPVLVSVIRALGKTGQSVAREELNLWLRNQEMASLSSDLAASIEGALLRLDPMHPIQPLLDMLGAEDPAISFAALHVLIEITGSDQGLDPLIPPAERQDALAAAAEALGRHQNP